MASSCGPYHEEALRRQRVIDRKRAATARLAIEKEREEEERRIRAYQEEQDKQERHAAKMRELQKHFDSVRNEVPRRHRVISGCEPSAGEFSRVASHPDLINRRREIVRPTSIMGIPTPAYKDIKGKEKILRNHNLYQAHPAVLWKQRPQSHV